MKKQKALSVVLGERLRALRELIGKRQEDIAVAARFWGLEWNRVTVATLEIGRRQLRLEEFLLLPGIFLQAGLRITEKGRTVTPELGDLFQSDAWVILTGTTSAPPDRLQEFFAAQRRISPLDYPYVRYKDMADLRVSSRRSRVADPWLRLATLVEQERYYDVNHPLIQYIRDRKNPEEVQRCIQAFKDQHGDAELTAARKLQTTPFVVALVALQHWGRSLTVERETRLTDQVTTKTPARTVQALRGHITRELLADLLPHVHALLKNSGAWQEDKKAG